ASGTYGAYGHRRLRPYCGLTGAGSWWQLTSQVRLHAPVSTPPEYLLSNAKSACADFIRNMLGDEGGGWIWSTPEPSGTGQRISTILPLCKNFFAAGIRAGGHFRCRKPARVAKPWPKDETC